MSWGECINNFLSCHRNLSGHIAKSGTLDTSAANQHQLVAYAGDRFVANGLIDDHLSMLMALRLDCELVPSVVVR
jgi:hypothetical protein